jgi:IS4 transposase
MILGKAFENFVKESPLSVMLRGLLENLFTPQKLNEWYQQTAIHSYTRELLFSSVFELMQEVVFGVHPSIHAAYQNRKRENIGVSVTALYNKLNGMELTTAAALVRYSAQQTAPLVQELGAAQKDWLPGLSIKILDGNCLEASEHRLKVLRAVASAPLPGKSLVIFNPALGVITEVFPCEDGHTQERALLKAVQDLIQSNDLWMADRNFCVTAFLREIMDQHGFFLIRQHRQMPLREGGAFKFAGGLDSGKVFEQSVFIENARGQSLKIRRIKLVLDQPTRDGEKEIFLLSNLSRQQAGAKKIAKLYAKRWSIETAFQQLEKNLHSEINTLAYPRAALFGFCVALVAYNLLAVILAALRGVHGQKKIQTQVSSFYLSLQFKGVYQGMMIALPPAKWKGFQRLSPAQLLLFLKDMAAHVDLQKLKKHSRGPKKVTKKRKYDKRHPHVATSRLLKPQPHEIYSP